MKHTKNLKGFTLVELIVTITIVAILGTLAFTQMGSFQKDARDSKRITNISTIAAGFNINMAAGKLINTSETSTGYNIVITGSTFTMTGYYGQINNKLLDSLKVYSKDITTTTDYPYSYSYFPTEKKYQVSSFLENSSNLPTAMNFIDPVYAADTSTGYVYIKGNFSATGGINSLIPDTTTWTDAIPNPDGTKTIPGSSTTVPGTTASVPPPVVVVTPIDATCGTANKDYLSTDTTFGSDTFCTATNSTLSGSTPTFPATGSSINWTCNSTTGGIPASCTATRQSPANCIAGTYTKNTHNYNVPQLNHDATGSVISDPPTAITYGTQTFTMIYGCTNGTVYEVSTEGVNVPVCDVNYHWDNTNCTADNFTVTYNTNGGGTPSPTTQSVAYNTAVGTLATVARTGYTFNGWFTTTTGGTQITTATVVTAAVTWYAQWTLAAYSSAITYVAGNAFTYTLPSGSTVTVNVTGPGYGTVAGTKTLHTPACDTDDIVIWQNGTNNVQVWAACNVGASVAVPYASSATVVAGNVTPDATEKTRIGNLYQWGNKADITSAGTSATQVTCTNVAGAYNTATFIKGFNDWCSTINTDNRWGNTDNTSIARQGPCPTGYHVPSGGTTDTITEWGKAYIIANSMAILGTCNQITGTQPYDRLRCAMMIPLSGYRASDSLFTNQGAYTAFWSSSPFTVNSYAPFFGIGAGPFTSGAGRAFGFSVRCIKN